MHRLVNGSGVDGVYLDQLGAASATLDWTVGGRSHGVGGGAWWRRGVASLIRRAREASGGRTPLVVESNSEMVLGEASGLLTLQAYGAAPLVQRLQAPLEEMVAPAFPAVYGAYVHVHMCMCTCAYAHVRVHVCVCTCACAHVRVHMCVCTCA